MAVDEDVPGLAWASRYQEKLHPEKVIPGRRTYSELFAEVEHLHERDTVVGQILVSIFQLPCSRPTDQTGALERSEDQCRRALAWHCKTE